MAGPESASDKPKPDAAKTSASADDAASYVGRPARGYLDGCGRRRCGSHWSERQPSQQPAAAFSVVCSHWFPGRLVYRVPTFFLPRTLFEPPTVFKIGYPSDYALGVDTKWQQKYRIWVDRTPDRVFVIYARCTHLGCTPDWKASENKFKCPCHGSGYDSEGVNFEGPAPRPMDRAHL